MTNQIIIIEKNGEYLRVPDIGENLFLFYTRIVYPYQGDNEWIELSRADQVPQFSTDYLDKFSKRCGEQNLTLEDRSNEIS